MPKLIYEGPDDRLRVNGVIFVRGVACDVTPETAAAAQSIRGQQVQVTGDPQPAKEPEVAEKSAPKAPAKKGV